MVVPVLLNMEWYRHDVSGEQSKARFRILDSASGSWGCGALNGSEWFQLQWAGLGTTSGYNYHCEGAPANRDSSSSMRTKVEGKNSAIMQP